MSLLRAQTLAWGTLTSVAFLGLWCGFQWLTYSRSLCFALPMQQVLGEIKDTAATPVALRAVRLLAAYLHPELSKPKALAALEALVADTTAAANPTVQFVAATVYMHEGNYNVALRLLKESTTLEQ
jgi:hypothetical protein